MRLDPDLPLPSYARIGDAGLDLSASHDVVLAAGGGRALVSTGFAVAIPEGHAGFIQPRSGLALKHGITLPNTPGTIDSDYRGPLGVLLINLGAEPYTIHHGDRIAQLIVAPVVQARFEAVAGLSGTARGEGGFGSTGRG